MSDNDFQFNWYGKTREPSYPYAQPQDGSAQARAAYIAKQSADMQGYRPLPNMSGYQPMISGRNLSPNSNPLTEPEMDNIWAESKYKLEERIAANEQRIEELKQEYLVLQQEQETATEDLERNVAANRAGIGDTSQYNAWRARVEAREAQNQAREADSAATLRQLRNQVDMAAMDVGIARGTRATDIAQANYKAKLAEYNAAARKMGYPELSENKLATKNYITEADLVRYRIKHRDSKGVWDSPENQQKYYEMAGELGLEGAKLQEEAAYQSNKPAEDAKKKKLEEEKREARRLVQKYQNMTEPERIAFSSRWNKNDPNDSEIKLLRKYATFDGNAPSMK